MESKGNEGGGGILLSCSMLYSRYIIVTIHPCREG